VLWHAFVAKLFMSNSRARFDKIAKTPLTNENVYFRYLQQISGFGRRLKGKKMLNHTFPPRKIWGGSSGRRGSGDEARWEGSKRQRFSDNCICTNFAHTHSTSMVLPMVCPRFHHLYQLHISLSLHRHPVYLSFPLTPHFIHSHVFF
jgi:hypothetical protein